MKKFLAIFFALVLVLSVAAVAFAASSPTVPADAPVAPAAGGRVVAPAPAPASAVIVKAEKEDGTEVKVLEGSAVADAADFVKEQMARTDAKVLGVWVVDESAKAEGDEWVTVTVKFVNVPEGTVVTFTCADGYSTTATVPADGVVTVRLPYGPFAISIAA